MSEPFKVLIGAIKDIESKMPPSNGIVYVNFDDLPSRHMCGYKDGNISVHVDQKGQTTDVILVRIR